MMKMRSRICIGAVLGLALTGFAATAAHAQYPDRDRNPYQDQGRYGRFGNETNRFTDRDIHIIRDWYRDHPEQVQWAERQERFTGNVEDRLRPGDFLDRDIRRMSHPVPDDLEFGLDPLPRYWRYTIVADHIMIVDDEWRIRDIYHFDEFSDHDRQVIRQWNQQHPDVLRGILGGFGVRIDDGDLDRRLQVGAIVDQDLARRARPAPDDLVQQLSPQPRDFRYVIIGDRLVLVDRDWRVHESFHFER
jgi:hypothetical protein